MIERFEHLSLQWFTHEPFGAIAPDQKRAEISA
jgi:hypothetical protein